MGSRHRNPSDYTQPARPEQDDWEPIELPMANGSGLVVSGNPSPSLVGHDFHPLEPPARTDADILASILVNLEWALDVASIKLGRLKPGSSAAKTQGGIVRGLKEAYDLVRSECHPGQN